MSEEFEFEEVELDGKGHRIGAPRFFFAASRQDVVQKKAEFGTGNQFVVQFTGRRRNGGAVIDGVSTRSVP